MAPSLSGSWIDLPQGSLEEAILSTPSAPTAELHTRLGCTIGYSSRGVAELEALLRAGMKVARFDFTYGSGEFHQESIDNLRVAMANTKIACGIMLDTRGSELVVMNRQPGPINITAGQTLTLTCVRAAQASSSVLPISTLDTFDGCNIVPGTQVLIGQYLFTGAETSSAYLTVQDVSGVNLTCVANNTTQLDGPLLTVHISKLKYNGPVLCEEDVKHIMHWGKQNQVDFISLSFTRGAKDIAYCREVLKRADLSRTQVFAKIESLEALASHVEIIDTADAVIFSRGNLGTCLDPEKVFLAQKMLLRAANIAGKPVYVTRVVDTMTEAPRPTRAEATDVANLVLDGADGILLGSETFRGKYPVDTVKTVAAIAHSAESCFDAHEFYRSLMTAYGCYTLHPHMDKAEALTSSAVRAAAKVGAKLILVFTVTGRTARLMSKYKPSAPILAVVCRDASSAVFSNDDPYTQPATRHPRASMAANDAAFTWNHKQKGRQCLMYRGVTPITAATGAGAHSGELLEAAIEYAKSIGMVQSGDRVVVSQCPRTGVNETMEEAGVVKLITVDDFSDAIYPSRMTARTLSLDTAGSAPSRIISAACPGLAIE